MSQPQIQTRDQAMKWTIEQMFAIDREELPVYLAKRFMLMVEANKDSEFLHECFEKFNILKALENDVDLNNDILNG